MPHFYLNLYNATGLVRDEEGTELPHLDAARDLACASIRDILSEEAKRGLINLRGRIEITDGDAAVLERIPFSRAVALHLDVEGQ